MFIFDMFYIIDIVYSLREFALYLFFIYIEILSNLDVCYQEIQMIRKLTMDTGDIYLRRDVL